MGGTRGSRKYPLVHQFACNVREEARSTGIPNDYVKMAHRVDMLFFEYSDGIIQENSIAAEHRMGILYPPNGVAENDHGFALRSLASLLLRVRPRANGGLRFRTIYNPPNGPPYTLLCDANIEPKDP